MMEFRNVVVLLIALILIGCTSNKQQTSWNDLENIQQRPVNNDIPKIESEILNK
ncbi:hypothetical protein RHO12_07765 [Orbus sturtevantii]|uniref:hypothetical protein n=1 Tax=Orbus sturtevantii TaxID=3074109 RepID=UPI00370DB006